MSKAVVISEAEARTLYEQGYPIAAEPSADSTPWWRSAAMGPGAFDEFVTWRRNGGQALRFFRPPAGRKTYDEAAGHIFRREAFAINSMRGIRNVGGTHCGDLPPKWKDALASDIATIGVEYVVYSYSTPIAWVRRLGRAGYHDPNSGGITIPPVRYSNTTTQHQWLTASALGQKFTTTESAREGKGRSPYGSRAGW